MKIDIFAHFTPPKYKEELFKKADRTGAWSKVIPATPGLFDVESRLNLIEKYDGLVQVLSLAPPNLDEVFEPEKAARMAKLANDEMAALVARYPDKFISAVACLPMNNMEAALEEVDRAIKDLKFSGVQISTPVDGKPLDAPELMPLYEKMYQYDLPVWIHPNRSPRIPDYINEEHSKYSLCQTFSWPFETTLAMARLVFSGIMERYPGIKFITHHGGAMVPYFAERIIHGNDYSEVCLHSGDCAAINKPSIDYFHMFYNDTALSGSTAALMCCYAFFGAEHMLFGTDVPYDSERGDRFTRETIRSIEQMDIPDEEKDLIFWGNAKKF